MSIIRALPGPISVALLGLLAAEEYKDLQGSSDKSNEASNQAAALSKGPSVSKGVFTPDLELNILEEYAEDYKNGKLGYYNSVVIPETGGKTAPLLLTDDEKDSLQKNFSALAKNYAILKKYQDNELGIDPKDFNIGGLKQAIADQLLAISNIEKQGLMRLKPGEQTSFGFSLIDAAKSLENNILRYGKEDAGDRIGKGYFDRKQDKIKDEIKSYFNFPEIFTGDMPELNLDNFKIPVMLPDNFPVTEGEWDKSDKVVSFNNTNNIGGTKTILRLVESQSDNANQAASKQITRYEQTYPSQSFADLVPMVRQFFQSVTEKVDEKFNPKKDS
jgi:hypothetical protein